MSGIRVRLALLVLLLSTAIPVAAQQNTDDAFTPTSETDAAHSSPAAGTPESATEQTATAEALATETPSPQPSATESSGNPQAPVPSIEPAYMQTEAAQATNAALEAAATETAIAEQQELMTATAEFGHAIQTVDAEYTATAEALISTVTPTPTPNVRPRGGLLAYAAPADGAVFPTRMLVQNVDTGTITTILEVEDSYTMGKPVWAPWGTQLYFTVHGDGPDAGIWVYGYGDVWHIPDTARCMMPAVGDLPDMIHFLCEESPGVWNVSVFNMTAGMMHGTTYPIPIQAEYHQLDVHTFEYNTQSGLWLLAWDSDSGFNACKGEESCSSIVYDARQWDVLFETGIPILFAEFVTPFDYEGPWNIQYDVDQDSVLGLICEISCTANPPVLFDDLDAAPVWFAPPGTTWMEFDQHPDDTWWAFSIGGVLYVGTDPQNSVEIGSGFTPAWQPVPAEL